MNTYEATTNDVADEFESKVLGLLVSKFKRGGVN